MTIPTQEQEIQRTAAAFVAALNAAGCRIDVTHQQIEVTTMGESRPAYKHSICMEIVRTKRIEVG